LAASGDSGRLGRDRRQPEQFDQGGALVIVKFKVHAADMVRTAIEATERIA
jgi:hypothetical protein